MSYAAPIEISHQQTDTLISPQACSGQSSRFGSNQHNQHNFRGSNTAQPSDSPAMPSPHRPSRSAKSWRTQRSGRDTMSVSRNFMDSTDPTLNHDIIRYQRSPGPIYNTGAIVDKFTLARPTDITIPRAGMDREKPVPVTPGPTDYSPHMVQHSRLSTSPRTVFEKAKLQSSLIRPTIVEGPAHDPVPIDRIKSRQPRSTMDKAKRTVGVPIEKTPGPGDYDVTRAEKRRAGTPKGTFGTSSRGSSSWIFG
ncbi:hypothetical protein BLNAU_7796 [Blattamonas nauphoetae]|uniref:Uncharacterized protein n=1 Tax=Blattamonas nauphoetae TaxID=2049346 RepID=A0ABQ9Y0C6_9EUKA|nr:hypothetical protein BLNAU_7796 [Blattamonas nauphoetae]